MAVAEVASACTRCRLAETRTRVVFGAGDPGADLLIIGEGPGADEDLSGLPFVGRSGKLLDRLLDEELGLVRSQVYVTNVVRCRPPANRAPRPDEAAACRPWLETILDAVAPRVVVTLGATATRWLLGTRETIGALRGRDHEWRGVLLVPTYHPSAALRNTPGALDAIRDDLGRVGRALAPAA